MAGPSVATGARFGAAGPGVSRRRNSCKNLYDPALAQDGKIYNNSDGIISSTANYAVTGLIPVEEGNRYTFSAPTPRMSSVVHFWGASGASQYLGGTTVGYPATGMNVVFRTSGRTAFFDEVSFTVPVGSGVRYFGTNVISNTAHTTAEFDATRGGSQIEIADPKTSFEPYVPNCVVPPVSVALLRAIKSGSTFYMRCKFNSTNDLVIRVDLAAGSNGVTNWDRTFFVPVATPDSGVAALEAGSGLVHDNDDDATPLRYNSETVGANHGHTRFLTVTATGHGKATADIGSRWVDGGARAWTLIKVADANTLWMMSDYTKAGDIYTFSTTMTGNLTHVSGATNTAGVTVSAAVTGDQIYPTVKGLTASALLDGATDITSAADGTYRGAFVDFTNDYEITDLASVLDYIKAHPGVAADFDAPEIETGARLSIRVRLRLNGTATVTTTLNALKQIQIGNCGFVQSGALNTTSRNLFEYIPGTLPITGPTKTWNFTNVEDISAGVDSLVFTPTYWTDANNPPSRMVQVLKETDGTPVIGWMLAYDPVGLTAGATRKGNVNQAIDMRNTRKQYPNALTAGSTNYPAGNVPAGSTFQVVAHRLYFNPNAQPNATVAAYIEDSAGALLCLDYHQSVTGEAVALPAQFVGMAVSVVDKSASFTVNSATVGASGISVTVTGGYGYAVLRLAA